MNAPLCAGVAAAGVTYGTIALCADQAGHGLGHLINWANSSGSDEGNNGNGDRNGEVVSQAAAGAPMPPNPEDGDEGEGSDFDPKRDLANKDFGESEEILDRELQQKKGVDEKRSS